MVKHTQTICRLLPTNCLSVFDHFVGLALKGLNSLSEVVVAYRFCYMNSGQLLKKASESLPTKFYVLLSAEVTYRKFL